MDKEEYYRHLEAYKLAINEKNYKVSDAIKKEVFDKLSKEFASSLPWSDRPENLHKTRDYLASGRFSQDSINKHR